MCMKHKSNIVRSQLTLLKPFIENCSLQTARMGQDKLGKLMEYRYKDGVSCEEFFAGNVKCAMLTPSDKLSDGIIMYLHGGGFISGGLDYAKGFGTVLCSECGVNVICVSYRLAPENIFPAALDDAMDVYGYLLCNGYAPSQIILCGDSAGGGLCYSLCMKLREKGRTVPAGIIAISPWVDLTASGGSYAKNKKADPSMTAERLKYFADCYVYGQKESKPVTNPDAEDDKKTKSMPLISPLFGELEKMPDSLIFSGGDEIMLDDAVALHEKLRACGCVSEHIIAPGMWHGYVLYDLAEFSDDYNKIRRFVKRTLKNQKKLRWMSLDNAAKIFPAAKTRRWLNVFRLSATMKEKVDVDVLQSALDVTVRRFPSIAVSVRTGFFWYYLEQIPKAPKIIDEMPYPLSRMPFDDIRRCAFRVISYENRIAVEFFHALTDGNGAFIFLKTLVAEYIYQKYGAKIPAEKGILDRLEEPDEDELEDSFFKYAGPKEASRKDVDAYRVSGTKCKDGFRTNTTFIMDADAVVAEAKKRGVTVTAFMVSALILAVSEIQKKKVPDTKKHMALKVHVPVNLRKLFPSKTLRNFALYATPGIDPALGEYEFDEVCKIIQHQMKLQITEKNMSALIAANISSEKVFLIRAVPLFLKNIVMKSIFNAVGERKSCLTFSNLGVAQAPDEFGEFVDRLDFVLGVQSSAPYNTSAITYKGKMNLNIIRNISEPLLEPELYRILRDLGIKVIAESNTRESE